MRRILLFTTILLVVAGSLGWYIYYRLRYLPLKAEALRIKEADDKLYMKSPFTRMEGVDSLMKEGKAAAVRRIVERLPLEKDLYIMDYMIRRGGEIRDEGALDYLTGILKKGRELSGRLFAFHALLSNPSRREEALRVFAGDGHHKVRSYAATAYRRYPGLDSTPLLNLLKDSDRCVRAWASYSLAEIEGEASLPYFTACLNEGDEGPQGMKGILRSILARWVSKKDVGNIPIEDPEVQILESAISVPSPESIFSPIARNRVDPLRSMVLAEWGIEPERVSKGVDLALRWMQIHQEEDGSWRMGKYNPHFPREIPQGYYAEDDFWQTASAGLGIIAFAMAGNTHRWGIYRETVEKALNFILTNQDRWGMFSTLVKETGESHEEVLAEPHTRVHRLGEDKSIEKGGEPEPLPYANITLRYNHSVSLLALVELYLMTGDPSLLHPIERGIRYMGRVQIPKLGFSFFFEPTDICPSMYAIVSLILAKRGGMKVAEDLLLQAEKYLHFMTDEAKGTIEPHCAAGYGSTATGMVTRALLFGREDPLLARMAETFLPHPPQWFPNNWIPLVEENPPPDKDNVLDFKYYETSTMALFLSGHPSFREWYKKTCGFFLDNQIQYGDNTGTLQPDGLWSVYCGRFYSAFCLVMTLLTPVQYSL